MPEDFTYLGEVHMVDARFPMLSVDESPHSPSQKEAKTSSLAKAQETKRPSKGSKLTRCDSWSTTRPLLETDNVNPLLPSTTPTLSRQRHHNATPKYFDASVATFFNDEPYPEDSISNHESVATADEDSCEQSFLSHLATAQMSEEASDEDTAVTSGRFVRSTSSAFDTHFNEPVTVCDDIAFSLQDSVKQQGGDASHLLGTPAAVDALVAEPVTATAYQKKAPRKPLMPADPTTKYRKIMSTYGFTAIHHVDFTDLFAEYSRYVAALELAAPNLRPSPFPFAAEMRAQQQAVAPFQLVTAPDSAPILKTGPSRPSRAISHQNSVQTISGTAPIWGPRETSRTSAVSNASFSSTAFPASQSGALPARSPFWH